MILVDALYINQSGGKVLLEYLIKTLIKKQKIKEFYFLFDQRLSSVLVDEVNEGQKQILIASAKNRTVFYKEQKDNFSTVFCFANVPPPITLQQPVYIFFHNALLLTSSRSNYSFLTKLKLLAKRLYIRSKNVKNYTWIVQTPSMEQLLCAKLNLNRDRVKVLPIYEEGRFSGLNKQLSLYDGHYLYVADGVKQKNHQLLLKAWEILLKDTNQNLTLHLTIAPNYNQLIDEINRLKKLGCLIINHGLCNFEQLANLYAHCNYFISPSLSESFGLPLIEAAEAGCEIIAADLDYVYDIVSPLATFNPHSAEDLVQCIRTLNASTKKITILKVKNEIDQIINLLSLHV